ncbi:hypothetical protein QE152_g13256 [Popillia japonica]|uniref:Uncharacterized protein n=1 Tax=Popillia japonica TaxID=7064 RepID=A0AAW1LEU8_POPJA
MELAQLKRKRGTIRSSLTKFSTYIESQTTEITISEETRKDFEEEFYTVIGKARNSIIINTVSEHSNIPSSNIQSDVLMTHIKLPTLTLPKFDGNYADWLSFNKVMY